MPHLLSIDDIRVKCHIGEGSRCCKFLGAGVNGFECLSIVPDLRTAIEAKMHMNARSGPCANPFDSVSEAAAFVVVADVRNG